jgi:hypothetical protein
MEEPFDIRPLATRARLVLKEAQKSSAFPALIGGIAGGVAGALIAAIISRSIATRNTSSSEYQRTASDHRASWSFRELAELLAIIGPLAKQLQGWYKAQRKG